MQKGFSLVSFSFFLACPEFRVSTWGCGDFYDRFQVPKGRHLTTLLLLRLDGLLVVLDDLSFD